MSTDKIKPINIPERQLTTSQQVNTLLGVASHFWAMLNAPQMPDDTLPRVGTVQGESRLAAETTFIKTCEALQLILDEKPRWDFSFQQSLEKDYAEAMSLNKDFLVAQRHAARENASPHNRRSPVLHKLTDGTWMAILGNLMDMENAIIGVGKCPQEALEAFDLMFNGEVPDSVTEFINKYTYETNEQNQNMDGSGNQQTQNPPSPGQDSEGDSGSAGQIA
jgi:hypothetical protein